MQPRVVIFRIDKIGDLIVSTPVLPAIKARHPNAKIMVVASPYNAVALEGLPEVNEVVLYDKVAPLRQKFATLKKIRAFKPTHTLVLSPKNDCYFLALLSGAADRGGLVTAYRWLPRYLAPLLLNHHISIPRRGKRPHQADGALALARRMGLGAEGDFPYRLVINEKARAKVKQLLAEKGVTQPFIAVHLSDKWLEVWKKEELISFLHNAAQALNVQVVATAGPADKKLGELDGKIPVFSNLPFSEWCAIFDQSSCVVAHDGSPFHIACALEKPLLAIYLSWHLDEAVSGFGPRGTRFRTRVIGDSNAQEDSAHLIDDLKNLLSHD